MGQYIPDKPDYLSSDEWKFILKRDKFQCALAPLCALRGVVGFCDETLDLDHEQPRELAGDNSFRNIRLLCANENRGRPVAPTQAWSEENFWDEQNVKVGELRQIQQLAGWNAIDELERDGRTNLQELRKLLLGSTTLLVGATGIGKTLLFQSIAFRINRLIGRGYPRVKHVLWLATDNTLRDLGRKELETEAYDLKIIPRRPVIQVADSFDSLIALGGEPPDITVITTHMLWRVEQSDGTLRRSDDDIRAALAPFDTIVFDEGDWANEEVRHMAVLANHAWQFALTASPRIPTLVGEKDAQKFLSRFVLIAPEAVADYARAVQLDSCLKLLSTPLTKAGNDGREEFEKGLRRVNPDKVSEDLIHSCSLIVEAVIEADHLETRMKDRAPDDYYSPHVMVRLDTTKEIQLALPIVQARLDELKASGIIVNPGWNVAMLFAGMRAERPELRDLSAKDKQGRWRHPFMRAKNFNGRADEPCCRVLLMCNIGVRGINNWPIQTIVDCSKRMSPIDLIQFDFGRAIRWPNHLTGWLDPKSGMSEFATLKIMLPPTDYADSKSNQLSAVRAFIDNMLAEISEAGFLSWADLLAGRKIADAVIKTGGSNRPLTQSEKFQVQDVLAKRLEEEGSLRDVPIEDLVTRCFPQHTDDIRAKLTEYGTRLLDPGFREQELLATPIFEVINKKPECVIDKLIPQQQYDLDTLARWVRSDPLFQQTWPECIERLQKNDRLTMDMVSDRLRFIQLNNYRSPARIYELNSTKKGEPGVFEDVANELASQLYDARQEPGDKGIVPAAIRSAACRLFGFDDTQGRKPARNGGPMDQPAYHIAILGKYRRTLQAMARAMVVREGQVWPALKRLADTK